MRISRKTWFRVGAALAVIPVALVSRRLTMHLLQMAESGGTLGMVTAAGKSVTTWVGGIGTSVIAAVLGRDELRLWQSAAMRLVQDRIGKVALTRATVLIRGESGVGKEVVARAIHEASSGATGPFVKVNCAAIPLELLESELFGHERGAFTGAHSRKPGKFELARGGTLFLDEIADLPLELQAKLLHVLQDGEFSRVGGNRSIPTDVHLIAATNQDLELAVAEGRFRQDLYYRLNVIDIHVPPLRERAEEIPGLVEHFLQTFNALYGRAVEIPPDSLDLLQRYHWPGNVRELENSVKRMVVLNSVEPVNQEILTRVAQSPAPTHVAPTGNGPGPGRMLSLKEVGRQAAREAERKAIMEVLDRVHWNRAKAARELRVSYKALLYKLVDLGLVDKPDRDGSVA
jgi:two-component system response regulator AtoC